MLLHPAMPLIQTIKPKKKKHGRYNSMSLCQSAVLHSILHYKLLVLSSSSSPSSMPLS